MGAVARTSSTQTAGKTKEETGLADAYYRLYGGGVGGPIVKNRTFFWAAHGRLPLGHDAKPAGDLADRESAQRRFLAHDDRRRAGRALQPVVPRRRRQRAGVPATGTGSIATGGLFTNAIIPLTHPGGEPGRPQHPQAWPTETIQGPMAPNEDGNPNAIGTAFVVDKAIMYTFKGEHKFTDKSSLSGFYIYNKTDEPGSTIMKADKLFMADQDQWFGPLRRRPHVLVFNNTNILNDTTVLSLRYGWTTWQDSCDKQAFTPGLQSLGFSPAYVNALGPDGPTRFPSLAFDEAESVGGWGGIPGRWKGPYAINGALTKLRGQPQLQGRRRRPATGRALATAAECPNDSPALGGCFQFNPPFTSRNGVGGNEVASLLLGSAVHRDRCRHDPGDFEWFTKYWGRLFPGRLARELEVHAELRPASRARGRPAGNRQPADGRLRPECRSIRSTRWCRRPERCSPGKTLQGRPDLRRRQRRAEHQGNPKAIKPAPRVGATYALDHEDRRSRRLRPVLGAVELQHGAARPDRLRAVDARSASRRPRAKCR